MPGFKDITNQRYGRLVAVEPIGSDVRGQKLWRCQCDCGNSHIISGAKLRHGVVKSCGCSKGFSHRMSRGSRGAHPLYSTWLNMRNRCNNPNSRGYRWYGARGIKACERWDNFAVFVANVSSEIGDRPPGLTLDRIDNNGNYEPGNIRWATQKEQVHNSRTIGSSRHARVRNSQGQFQSNT